MIMWTVDIGSAALLTALEVVVLAAFWFAEGLKQWAAGGARPPGATTRLFLVLTVGPIGLVAVSYGFYRADLPVACGSQALLAAALILLLALGEERSAPACLPRTPQGVVRSVSAFAGEGERLGGTASDGHARSAMKAAATPGRIDIALCRQIGAGEAHGVTARPR